MKWKGPSGIKYKIGLAIGSCFRWMEVSKNKYYRYSLVARLEERFQGQQKHVIALNFIRYAIPKGENQSNLREGTATIGILVNWMQIACLFPVEEDGCKLSHDCFTMCVVLILTNLVGHVPFNARKTKKNLLLTCLTHL